MPVRDESLVNKGMPADAGNSGVKTKEDKLNELALLGVEYVRIKKDEKLLGEKVKTNNAIIKEKFLEYDDLYVINGNHKEIYAPLGDGMNELFLQLQGKESVSMVDDVIAQVRKKLGKKAEDYINKVEVIHPTALESMKNAGLLTDADILELTVTKKSESLIIKINKTKK